MRYYVCFFNLLMNKHLQKHDHAYQQVVLCIKSNERSVLITMISHPMFTAKSLCFTKIYCWLFFWISQFKACGWLFFHQATGFHITWPSWQLDGFGTFWSWPRPWSSFPEALSVSKQWAVATGPQLDGYGRMHDDPGTISKLHCCCPAFLNPPCNLDLAVLIVFGYIWPIYGDSWYILLIVEHGLIYIVHIVFKYTFMIFMNSMLYACLASKPTKLEG